jgi:hypothetical protein
VETPRTAHGRAPNPALCHFFAVVKISAASRPSLLGPVQAFMTDGKPAGIGSDRSRQHFHLACGHPEEIQWIGLSVRWTSRAAYSGKTVARNHGGPARSPGRYLFCGEPPPGWSSWKSIAPEAMPSIRVAVDGTVLVVFTSSPAGNSARLQTREPPRVNVLPARSLRRDSHRTGEPARNFP